MAYHKEIYLPCECSTKDHVVCVSLHRWDEDDIDLSISVQLNHELGFFRRCWAALRYVFRIGPCRFGHWGETLLGEENAARLRRLVDDYLGDDCDCCEMPRPHVGWMDDDRSLSLEWFLPERRLIVCLAPEGERSYWARTTNPPSDGDGSGWVDEGGMSEAIRTAFDTPITGGE